MDVQEETDILRATGCPSELVDTLLRFAGKYRETISADNVLKSRRLGTRSLVRIARKLAMFPDSLDLHLTLAQSLLAEFLPAMERLNLNTLLEDSNIIRRSQTVSATLLNSIYLNLLLLLEFYLSPYVEENKLVFPPPSSGGEKTYPAIIPRFPASEDPEGVSSHVPHMDHFYDNSLQTGLMRDLAIDLELLKEHVVLLGNQGVGKNKIVDRLCQVNFVYMSYYFKPLIMMIISFFVALVNIFSFTGTQLSINLCSRRRWRVA